MSASAHAALLRTLVSSFEETEVTDVTPVFELLGNLRRQHVIFFTLGLDEEGQITTRELSREIAAIETGYSPDSVPKQARDRVYTNLIQHHLPRLARADVIWYDERAKVVKPGQNLVTVATILLFTQYLMLVSEREYDVVTDD